MFCSSRALLHEVQYAYESLAEHATPANVSGRIGFMGLALSLTAVNSRRLMGRVHELDLDKCMIETWVALLGTHVAELE